jgi:GWxTD domain-containing protein
MYRTLSLLLLLALSALPIHAVPVPVSDLAPKYQAWLEEVDLLMSPRERDAFLDLQKDYQRDAFIRRFWEVRDPFPQTPANEMKQRWEERAMIARQRLGGLSLTDDRARIFLYNGEPKEVFQARCDVLLPVEIWSYAGTDRIRGDFTVAFVSRSGSPKGPFTLWSPNAGIESLLSLDMRARLQDQERGFAAVADLCPRGEDTVSRLGEAIDWDKAAATLKLVPRPGEEWLSTFASYSTDVPEGAPSFPARFDLSFPARFGSRTVVQGLVTVPRQAMRPERIEGAPEAHYNFLVDGEILYKDELFEHFRYRFTLPETQVVSDEIPVVFQRYLRPGSYSLILKVEDTSGKRFFREQRTLEVPRSGCSFPGLGPGGSQRGPGRGHGRRHPPHPGAPARARHR